MFLLGQEPELSVESPALDGSTVKKVDTVVEARRIELLSEDKFTWLSPSASVDLDFLTAPRGGALCGSVAF